MFTYTDRKGSRKQVKFDPKEVMLQKVSFNYTWSKIKKMYQISNDKLNQIRESAEWYAAVFDWMSVQYNPSFSDIDERLKVRKQLIKFKKK